MIGGIVRLLSHPYSKFSKSGLEDPGIREFRDRFSNLDRVWLFEAWRGQAMAKRGTGKRRHGEDELGTGKTRRFPIPPGRRHVDRKHDYRRKPKHPARELPGSDG